MSYDDREEQRQGSLIVREIKARDGSITAYWSPGRGRVAVSVYSADEHVQDRVIETVTTLKARGEIDRIITIEFYERENWIEGPKNARGVWGKHRGPERQIRSVEL